MTVGDHVTTPAGPGWVIRFWAERRVAAGTPIHLTWVTVRLDTGDIRSYPPAAINDTPS